MIGLRSHRSLDCLELAGPIWMASDTGRVGTTRSVSSSHKHGFCHDVTAPEALLSAVRFYTLLHRPWLPWTSNPHLILGGSYLKPVIFVKGNKKECRIFSCSPARITCSRGLHPSLKFYHLKPFVLRNLILVKMQGCLERWFSTLACMLASPAEHYDTWVSLPESDLTGLRYTLGIRTS